MTEHPGAVTDVANRDLVVTFALRLGFNAYLPVLDDGIDLILYRQSDRALRKVRLTSRWTIDRRYEGRDIWIAFPVDAEWYLAPHDEMVWLAPETVKRSASWSRGAYTSARPPAAMRNALDRFRLGHARSEASEAAPGETNRGALEDLAALRRDLRGPSAITIDEIMAMRDEGRRH